MSEDNGLTRRLVLQNTGISLGALLGGSGMASASDSQSKRHRTKSGGIKVEDGKFVLDASPADLGQQTYRLSKAAVDNFNSVIEEGYFSIDGLSSRGRLSDHQTLQTSLKPSEGSTVADIAAVNGTDSLAQSVSLPQDQKDKILREDEVSIYGCNENDVKTNRQWLPPKVDVHIYMSDDTISDLSAAAGGVAPGGTAIYKYLVRKGYLAAGTLAGPVAVAVFAAVAAYWSIVLIQNNGCGVVIKTGLSPIDPLVPTPTVSSQ